jgi:release factor glutamine methyltransferase
VLNVFSLGLVLFIHVYSFGLMEEVYKPGEDSYLLQKYVEELVSGRVLDMGTGSGIQAVTAAAKNTVQSVYAVDVNPAALIAAERRALDAGVLSKIEFGLSDLFNNIEDRFDWIIFNPPYLPSSGGYDEASWAGGDTGGEVIKRFQEEARGYLTAGGSILMIYSSHSGLTEDDFIGYKVDNLEEIELFFEKIYCVRLTPS